MSAPVVARLSALLAPVVEATGHDLEGLEVTPAGRRRVVRVLVDRDGGTSLDDVAEVSRVLSEALDDIDAREPALLAGAYVLEVGSPGVDRPLTLPRHWSRNRGRLVLATLRDGGTVQGRLVEVTGTTVRLDDRELALADVARGQVQVEFGRRDEGPAQDEDALDPDDELDGLDDEGEEEDA